nr:T9SS type A sorting domain-containing protein [uncultured Draconibacterium sp.]
MFSENRQLFLFFCNLLNAVLEIHNMLGQRVVRLLDKPVEAGELQRVEFRPETEISGMYLYRLDINGDTRIGKLIYRNK